MGNIKYSCMWAIQGRAVYGQYKVQPYIKDYMANIKYSCIWGIQSTAVYGEYKYSCIWAI